MVMLHWWELASSARISTNILSLIVWSATSNVGCSSANSNVFLNWLASPSQSWFPYRNSIDAYHILGVISNVWMKWWTHSCHGYSANMMRHWFICCTGLNNPMYLWLIVMTSLANPTSINLLYCGHFIMNFLCVPHHLAGVAFSTWYNVDKCCDFVTRL